MSMRLGHQVKKETRSLKGKQNILTNTLQDGARCVVFGRLHRGRDDDEED